ncbi:MAG: hypothetical protein GXO70_06330 [Acidobacteria bacterium]|nr:hypothetical protein [Acidobacteriota bacterium]
MKKLRLSLIAVFVATISCQAPPVSTPTPKASMAVATHTAVTSKISSDPAIEKIIQPYREQLQKEMNTVIGKAEVDMVRGNPESLLGNFAADVILDTARHFGHVDFAITNNGGLRAPVYKGNITIGNMFELMPFGNRIVIAKFTGEQVEGLITEIVKKGGTPVSGLTIVSTGGIVNASIGQENFDSKNTYTIATINYLMDGGGNLESMWKGNIIKDTHVLLREALIAFVKKHRIIHPQIEGRIIIQ